MTHPLVVHYKRSRYDIYIGRPSIWGNPFGANSKLPRFRAGSREEAIRKYETWLLAQPELVAKARKELRGKILGCWCAPLPCHGEVLARVANEESPHVARGGFVVLVCGSTEFNNWRLLCRTLNGIDEEREITAIVHGCAPGADTLAGRWAREAGVVERRHPANWKLGRAAGPIRNEQMLSECPDLVVAFPGDRGTTDMIRKAHAARVRVREVT